LRDLFVQVGSFILLQTQVERTLFFGDLELKRPVIFVVDSIS